MIYCEGARYGKGQKACSKQLTTQFMAFVAKLTVAYPFKRIAVIHGT